MKLDWETILLWPAWQHEWGKLSYSDWQHEWGKLSCAPSSSQTSFTSLHNCVLALHGLTFCSQWQSVSGEK